MPEVMVRRLYPTAPELSALEAKIIAQRNEYAAWDLPKYQHIYLGIIEGGVDSLLQVFETEINLTRTQFPPATFILEYHPSCIPHSEYPFLVFSFTLIKSFQTEQGAGRQLIILSWKLPSKDVYESENRAIEMFMVQHRVQQYDDGSGVVCRVESGS